MALVDPFEGVSVPRGLAAEFFAVFARCEYAMKETGYRRDDHGIAAPAWQRLANDATGWLHVSQGSEVALAIERLTSDPPKLQTFAGGWQSPPLRGVAAIAQAIDAATRVRHNLFHGGKHTPEAEAGRDERLVRAALTLLVALVEECPTDLRGVYNYG